MPSKRSVVSVVMSVVIALLLIGSLVACSSGSDDSSNTNSVDSPNEVPDPSQDAEIYDEPIYEEEPGTPDVFSFSTSYSDIEIFCDGDTRVIIVYGSETNLEVVPNSSSCTGAPAAGEVVSQ